MTGVGRFLGGFRDDALRKTIEERLRAFPFLETTRDACELGAEYAAVHPRLGAGDAIIAATAVTSGAALWTADSDFAASKGKDSIVRVRVRAPLQVEGLHELVLLQSRERVAGRQRRESTEIAVRGPQLANPVLEADRRDSCVVHLRAGDPACKQQGPERRPVQRAFTEQMERR
jgi:hypothetical protein